MEKIYSLRLVFHKGLLLILILYLNFISVLATQLPSDMLTAILNEDEWVHHSETQGVKVSYQISTCGKEDVVFLKFDNTNTDRVKIEWQEEFWTEAQHINKGKEGMKSVSLDPGITSESNCVSPENPACVILARHIDPTRAIKILRYNMLNIQISKDQ